MHKSIRRGTARLALVPIVAAAAPLSTFVLPAIPAGATVEAPSPVGDSTPSLPRAIETFRTDGWIVDVAPLGDNRLAVLTDPWTLVWIDGDERATIQFQDMITTIKTGPDGKLYGIQGDFDFYHLVEIAGDGTITPVGEPLGGGMHMMMEFPTLQFDAAGAPTVLVPFGMYTQETRADYAKQADDGTWNYFEIGPENIIVGFAPQADGSVLYREDRTGDLHRFTPGEGSARVADLPDGYFLDGPSAGSLAGTSDGTVYFMEGSNVQRRLPSGDITTVGTLNDIAGFNEMALIQEGSNAHITIGSEGRLYLAVASVLYQLDLDTTAPVITVTGLTNATTLTRGESRQVSVACEDDSPMAVCTVTLDGKTVETVSLSDLDRGKHRLAIEAADVVGNSSSKAIEFNVVAKSEITGDLAASTGTAGTVARLYMAVFNRQPDGSGQNYWVAQRDGGASLQTIAKMFVTSSEFRETYDALDDDEFLAVLYRNVMDREPDAVGLTYWKGLMTGGLSRAEVTLWFSESAEFQQLTFTS